MQICQLITNLRNNKKMFSAKSIILKTSELKKLLERKVYSLKIFWYTGFLKGMVILLEELLKKAEL